MPKRLCAAGDNLAIVAEREQQLRDWEWRHPAGAANDEERKEKKRLREAYYRAANAPARAAKQRLRDQNRSPGAKRKKSLASKTKRQLELSRDALAFLRDLNTGAARENHFPASRALGNKAAQKPAQVRKAAKAVASALGEAGYACVWLGATQEEAVRRCGQLSLLVAGLADGACITPEYHRHLLHVADVGRTKEGQQLDRMFSEVCTDILRVLDVSIPGAREVEARTILTSQAGCERQRLHRDYSPQAVEASLKANPRTERVGTIPFGVLVAIEVGTVLQVIAGSQGLNDRGVKDHGLEVETLDVPVGSALVFHGNLVHGGEAYASKHKRLHFYATGKGRDSVKAPRGVYFFDPESKDAKTS